MDQKKKKEKFNASGYSTYSLVSNMTTNDAACIALRCLRVFGAGGGRRRDWEN